MYNKSRFISLFLLAGMAITCCLAGCKKKDMSLKLNEPHNIRGVISYKRSFGDLNEKHLNALLDTIGYNFLDSLAAKGLNPNKITVTSVLRTKDDVKRLRRRNGNASENSAHCYGTTFDVSWKRFQKVEDEDGRPLQDVSSDTLKLVLSEVLRDLKKAEKCYIKYELKQGCFHITTRM